MIRRGPNYLEALPSSDFPLASKTEMIKSYSQKSNFKLNTSDQKSEDQGH